MAAMETTRMVPNGTGHPFNVMRTEYDGVYSGLIWPSGRFSLIRPYPEAHDFNSDGSLRQPETLNSILSREQELISILRARPDSHPDKEQALARWSAEEVPFREDVRLKRPDPNWKAA